jgi:hypothetical protein
MQSRGLEKRPYFKSCAPSLPEPFEVRKEAAEITYLILLVRVLYLQAL